MTEIFNLSRPATDSELPADTGRNPVGRIGDVDVVGLLLQGRPAVPARLDAAVSQFYGTFGATDSMPSTRLESEQPEGKKPLKVSDKVEKFLKDELGVTEKYIDGDTVHFKLEAPITKEFPGAPKMWFDQDVNFKIKSKGDKVEISEINGLMAKPDFLPWLYVTRVVIAEVEPYTDPKTHKKIDTVATIHGGRGVYFNARAPVQRTVYNQLKEAVAENFGE